LGVRHNAPAFQYYGGSLTLNTVTTAGTDTETVKNGYPPDTEHTSIRPGGYTQGIIIDNSLDVALPPTWGFVTSLACYTITVPQYPGTYDVTFKLSNTVGTPEVRSVVSQNGESMEACGRNLKVQVQVSSFPFNPTYGSCAMGFSSSMAASTPELLAFEGVIPEGQAGAMGAANPFMRGDPNDDGNMNISDVSFILNFLFSGGQVPTCLDAADLNDDESIDISDAIFSLRALFVGNATVPWPAGPSCCGEDVTGAGSLDCQLYNSCPSFSTTDTDGDGLTDACEASLGTSSTTSDTWGPDLFRDGIPEPDGIPDGWDTDRDGFLDRL
jgi:hypothetical protein